MPIPPSTDGIWIGHAWLDTSQLLPGPGPQGFSVYYNQEGPSTFDFGTDEQTQHTNHWDFGDGSLVNAPVGEEVAHTYQEPGPYTVTVECHDFTGSCEVTAEANPDVPHQTSVFISGRDVTVKVVLGAPNTTYHYDWGDGESVDITLDSEGKGEISHTYATDGEYDVVGTDPVTDDVVTFTKVVVATNIDTDKIITYGHADFYYEFLLLNPDWSPVEGETLLWDFGDGAIAESTDSTLAVVHTYGGYGTYEVTCSWGSYTERLLLDIAAPPPSGPVTITSILPDPVIASGVNTTITITGTNFTEGMKVSFGAEQGNSGVNEMRPMIVLDDGTATFEIRGTSLNPGTVGRWWIWLQHPSGVGSETYYFDVAAP